MSEGGPRGNQSMFDLPETVASYLDYRLEGVISTEESRELQRARRRKLAIDAERAEFNLQVLKGRYLLAEAVGQVVTQQSLVIKSRVFGLGPRLCQNLAWKSDPNEIREILDEEAESICRLLTSDFTAAEAEADEEIARLEKDSDQTN